jgi:hypothetical protein
MSWSCSTPESHEKCIHNYNRTTQREQTTCQIKIKPCLAEMGCESLDWRDLANGTVQWLTSVNRFRKSRNFLDHLSDSQLLKD